MVYPEGTDPITPLQEVIKQALVADDTGWQSLTVEGSFDGTVEIRRINAFVTLSVNVRYGESSNGEQLCTIPEESRPSRTLRFPWTGTSQALGCQCFVNSSGTVQIYWASSQPSSNHYVRLTATWPRG